MGDQFLVSRAIAEKALAKAALGDDAGARQDAERALAVLSGRLPPEDEHVRALNDII